MNWATQGEETQNLLGGWNYLSFAKVFWKDKGLLPLSDEVDLGLD